MCLRNEVASVAAQKRILLGNGESPAVASPKENISAKMFSGFRSSPEPHAMKRVGVGLGDQVDTIAAAIPVLPLRWTPGWGHPGSLGSAPTARKKKRATIEVI